MKKLRALRSFTATVDASTAPAAKPSLKQFVLHHNFEHLRRFVVRA